MKHKILVLALSCTLVQGCASDKFIGRPGLEVVKDGVLPAPSRVDSEIQGSRYVIGASDQLDINVFNVPELSAKVTVDLNGRIALPLIGPMTVAGITSDELAATITERLRATYVREPKVAVNVSEVASQQFTVDGAVTAPGMFPFMGRMSLMRAIARASSTTEFAKEDSVVVLREANGKKYAALYNLAAIRAGVYEDPEIYSRDVILVGDNQARRVLKDVFQAAPLVTPLVFLFR